MVVVLLALVYLWQQDSPAYEVVGKRMSRVSFVPGTS